MEAKLERGMQRRTTQPERVRRMDRLPAVIAELDCGTGSRATGSAYPRCMGRFPVMLRAAILVGAVACGKSEPGEPPPRTNVAKVKVSSTATTEAFCDVH